MQSLVGIMRDNECNYLVKTKTYLYKAKGSVQNLAQCEIFVFLSAYCSLTFQLLVIPNLKKTNALPYMPFRTCPVVHECRALQYLEGTERMIITQNDVDVLMFFTMDTKLLVIKLLYYLLYPMIIYRNSMTMSLATLLLIRILRIYLCIHIAVTL